MNWNNIIGHDRSKRLLQRALAKDGLGHAYLLFGEDAIGKRLAALTFTQSIQCKKTNHADPCDLCDGCRAFKLNTHPDVRIIEPGGSMIKIDQIRAIQGLLVYRPLMGNRKVVLIDQADMMNPQAANAFLKTLEEPPDQSLILLITSRPDRLPSTVLSRCQPVRFNSPKREDITEWLLNNRKLPKPEAELLSALSMGKIGKVMTGELDDIKTERNKALDIVSIEALRDLQRLFLNARTCATEAQQWMTILAWVQIWIRDLLIARHGFNPNLLINLDQKSELSRQSPLFSVQSLLRASTLLNAFETAIHRNLNRTLALETILLELRSGLRGDSK